jgi:3-methyladenine DNA glycosylase/8-oxoguanine DNA glycosylase
MKKTLSLINRTIIFLKPKPPFHFAGTVHNPSHFPTPTEVYKRGKFWQAVRILGIPLGFKLENQGSVERPKIRLTLYSEKPLNKGQIERIVDELRYRFELDLDLSNFYNKFAKDKFLGPVLKKWRGIRSKCGYSLYESLMIYLSLQNATVKRTVQMMENLLKKFGTRVRFDNQELFCFWEPKDLAKVSEKDLRDLKVGYRAKYFIKISQDFLTGEFDEESLRKLKTEEILAKVDELYGIGPASARYLLFEVFHNHNLFDVLPPWEQKIYSKLLYDKDLVPADKILSNLQKRYGKWKRLAAHLIWSDLFWRHKEKPIPWLKELIKL